MFEGCVACEKGKVQSPVLFGESDGVWMHLQQEEWRSAKVRVATMYTGKEPIGEILNVWCTNAASAIRLSSEAWQENLLRTAHRYYDLDQVRLLITGGEGNQWVGNSFNRLAIKQVSVLGRFHLARVTRRALGRTRKAREITDRLRQKGI